MGRYTTVEAVRAALRAPNVGEWAPEGVQESQLEQLIETAEAMIDSHCGGPILAPAEASARVFTATHSRLLMVDFFAETPTSVERLNPRTRASESPVTRFWPDGNFGATRGLNTLAGGGVGGWRVGYEYRVTTRWGHPAIDPQVRTAARMQTATLYHRDSSPLGLVTGPDGSMAYAAKLNPEVIRMLADFSPTLVG